MLTFKEPRTRKHCATPIGRYFFEIQHLLALFTFTHQCSILNRHLWWLSYNWLAQCFASHILSIFQFYSTINAQFLLIWTVCSTWPQRKKMIEEKSVLERGQFVPPGLDIFFHYKFYYYSDWMGARYYSYFLNIVSTENNYTSPKIFVLS